MLRILKDGIRDRRAGRDQNGPRPIPRAQAAMTYDIGIVVAFAAGVLSATLAQMIDALIR